MQHHPWKNVVQPELTVRLTPRAKSIEVEYLQRGRLLATQPKHAATLTDALRALARTLSQGESDALRGALAGRNQVEVGPLLAALLFPDPSAANQTFKALAGSTAEQVHAERLPVRLRILVHRSAPDVDTEAADVLLSLPWSLTSCPFCDAHLASAQNRWTFEHSSERLGDETGRLPQPAKVLLIAPNGGAPTRFAGDLQSRLEQDDACYASSAFFKVVRDASEVGRAASDWLPHVVVFVGHARIRRGVPVLDFGDESLDAKALCLALPNSVQCFLSVGCWSGGGGAVGLGRLLAAQVPAVVTGLTRLDTAAALDLVTQWLVGIVLHELSPVQAVHTYASAVATDDHHAWTYAAHTRYDKWEFRRRPAERTRVFSSPVSHRLDRFNQRAHFRTRVDNFIKSDARVMAVVGIAPEDPDARPDLLSTLLREDLVEERCDTLVFNPYEVTFPSGTDDLPGAFEDAIRRVLGATKGGALADFLRVACPTPDPGQSALVWLDFGRLGGSSGASLTPKRLTAWLDMCSVLIEPSADHDVRVIAYLTTETRQPLRIEKIVTDWFLDAPDRGVDATSLGVLEHVTLKELADFMSTRGATGCPRGLIRSATRALFEQCAGVNETPSGRANYRCLIKAIEAAEAMGWRRFLGDPDDDGHDPDEEL